MSLRAIVCFPRELLGVSGRRPSELLGVVGRTSSPVDIQIISVSQNWYQTVNYQQFIKCKSVSGFFLFTVIKRYGQFDLSL